MRLLLYSLNIRYALTVRLLALLLLVNTVASACSSDRSAEEDNSNSDNRDIVADTTGVQPVYSAAPSTITFLGNPFVASRIQSNSLSTYFDKIQDSFTLDADPIENIHRTSITDTIYTIQFGSSVMEFYAPTQSGELLLQLADIRDNSISLRNNIAVGISQAELVTKLRAQNLKVRQSQNEITAIAKDGAPTSLQFYLKNGKVSRILYEGYVD
jgi:hypothetical protein